MKKLLIVFSILISQTFLAQTISGIVLDKEENPIVYATVQINDNFGVITNEEGKFEIETEKFQPTSEVKISFLGFKQLIFKLKDFESKTYYLEEEINTLEEVFVNGENLSLDEILKKVQENAATNYVNTNFKQQVFHRMTFGNTMKKFDLEFEKSNIIKKRELKKVNKSMDSVFDKMVNVTTKNYSDVLSNYFVGEKDTKLEVIKRTSLINKKKDKSSEKMLEVFLNVFAKHLEKGETYKVKSGLFKVTDSLDMEEDFKTDKKEQKTKTKYLKSKYNSIFKNNSIVKDSKLNFIFKTNKYEYTLNNTSYINGDIVYIIDFKPKKSSAKYVGTMYVNADDFAVVKAKFQLAKGKIVSKINLKFVLGMKMINNVFKSEILFQKNKNGKYQFKFIKQETGGYAYFSRPLKFTKNRKSRSDEKKMLKMRFLMEANQTQKDELFFIESSEITNEKFKNIVEKEKYKIQNIPKYSSEIWKGYNVLAPVQEIKDYDTGE